MGLSVDITQAYRDMLSVYGREVTYRRGAESQSLTSRRAVQAGNIDGQAVDASYMQTYTAEERFLAEDFTLGDPQRGDTIEETIGGNSYVYKVLPYDNKVAWRYTDTQRIGLAVPTVETTRTGS
jgi:hypothetical protein